MNSILKRRSIRKYTDEQVHDNIVEKLLQAAMAAPSAGNEQPWEFIIIRDKKTMNRITEVHPYASMLPQASVAIVVCGNLTKEKYKGFWVQDCSAATENILINVVEVGLGAVWLGVYPNEERAIEIQKILNLPDKIIPLSIIPIGYPDEEKEPANRYDASKVHYEKWEQ